MTRVVITGMGIVSSLGNNTSQVLASLQAGRSGICSHAPYREIGLRTGIHGAIDLDFEPLIDRKIRRFMGEGAAYTYLATRQALAEAGLSESDVSDERVGLISGSGGASTRHIVEMADTLRNRGLRRVGPFMVPRTMSSTTSACLATAFKIKGVNYTISSACATSAHCIGTAMEQIQLGRQDVMLAGGGESIHWTQMLPFDAMGALSTRYNDEPQRASRPYDAARDGFVISGGGGMLVLESLEHAQARGATIIAELVGYGATSDGFDMVQPSGEGAARCMRLATGGRSIDYINTHGTSTPAGDIKELQAIAAVFGADIPPISSTKSLSGHALGGAGVHEAIYSLLMMRHRFIAASANIDTLDPGAEGIPIVRQRRDDQQLDRVLSNSFGFGGTNACLVFERFTPV